MTNYLDNLKALAAECIRQEVGPTEMAYLVNTWEYLSDARSTKLDEQLILALGHRVEPEKNLEYVYRHTPVTIRGGSASADTPAPPHEVEARMKRLLTLLPNMTTDEFIREFLIIHPFADGNGRVAFLLQNHLNGKLYRLEPLVDHFPTKDFA